LADQQRRLNVENIYNGKGNAFFIASSTISEQRSERRKAEKKKKKKRRKEREERINRSDKTERKNKALPMLPGTFFQC